MLQVAGDLGERGGSPGEEVIPLGMHQTRESDTDSKSSCLHVKRDFLLLRGLRTSIDASVYVRSLIQIYASTKIEQSPMYSGSLLQNHGWHHQVTHGSPRSLS